MCTKSDPFFVTSAKVEFRQISRLHESWFTNVAYMTHNEAPGHPNMLLWCWHTSPTSLNDAEAAWAIQKSAFGVGNKNHSKTDHFWCTWLYIHIYMRIVILRPWLTKIFWISPYISCMVALGCPEWPGNILAAFLWWNWMSQSSGDSPGPSIIIDVTWPPWAAYGDHTPLYMALSRKSS